MNPQEEKRVPRAYLIIFIKKQHQSYIESSIALVYTGKKMENNYFILKYHKISEGLEDRFDKVCMSKH